MLKGLDRSRKSWRRGSAGAAFIALCAAAGVAQVSPSTPAAVASQSPAAPAPSVWTRFVVLLDAAHGGDDIGGKLDSQAEKDFNLAMSIRLRSLLAARGFQVVTTRESDLTIDSNRRAEIADHVNAQVCISLHASEAGRGVHLFASSLAPAQPARVSAWKTTQGGWVTRSLALAGVVDSALSHAGIDVTLGRTALPGIDSMACPALAIEISPDHAPDSKAKIPLEDPGYESRVADALAAALLEWKTEAKQP